MAISKQANFFLPEDLLNEFRSAVPARQQSKVVANVLRKELKRLKLKKSLQDVFGAWKEKDHPELKEGASKFVRRLRQSARLIRPQ